MNPGQNPDKQNRDADALLQRQFERMRAEDAAATPAFPSHLDPAELRARQFNRRVRGIFARTAVAASVLVVAGLLITERPAQEMSGDPAALYADIMAAYPLQTEELLSVSDTLAPEMLGLPEVLDAGLPQDSLEGLN